MGATAAIKEALQSGPLTHAQIADQAGVERQLVYATLSRMKRQGDIEKVGDAWRLRAVAASAHDRRAAGKSLNDVVNRHVAKKSARRVRSAARSLKAEADMLEDTSDDPVIAGLQAKRSALLAQVAAIDGMIEQYQGLGR